MKLCASRHIENPVLFYKNSGVLEPFSLLRYFLANRKGLPSNCKIGKWLYCSYHKNK